MLNPYMQNFFNRLVSFACKDFNINILMVLLVFATPPIFITKPDSHLPTDIYKTFRRFSEF